MNQVIQFSLNLSYEKFLHVYKGEAKFVVTKAFDGRTIRFPAEVLKPYLTREGVQGDFEITFNAQNKFQDLKKLRQ